MMPGGVVLRLKVKGDWVHEYRVYMDIHDESFDVYPIVEAPRRNSAPFRFLPRDTQGQQFSRPCFARTMCDFCFSTGVTLARMLGRCFG